MAAKAAKKKVVKKIMDWATKAFSGSGDVEKQDAIHIVDQLVTTYGHQRDVLGGTIRALKGRLEILDTTWSYRRQPVSTLVPCPPAEGVSQHITLSPLQLGFEELGGTSDHPCRHRAL